MVARLVNVMVLGFVLSLDNFRTSVLLGPLRMRRARMVLVAVNFGLWDGLAPLLGLLVGRYVGDAIGPIADYIGPLALLGYGAYLLLQAWRTPAPAEDDDEFEQSWTLFGLPLPLSVDNIGPPGVPTGLQPHQHPLRDCHRHRSNHRSRRALPPRRRRRLTDLSTPTGPVSPPTGPVSPMAGLSPPDLALLRQ